MLYEFYKSIPLFYHTYISSLAIAIFLSIIGIIVVNRQQIFLAVAISQAATLGLAINALYDLKAPIFLALVFSTFAAIAATKQTKTGGSSREEFTSWIFLFSGSVSVLLLAHHPQGIKHIQSILASSIIGATELEVIVSIIATIITIVCLLFLHRKLTLFIIDPTMAAAIGISIILWNAVISTSLGITVGFSVCSTGMLFTFGCIVLPALIVKKICNTVSAMYIVSPIVSFLITLYGLILANYYNFPPGQMVVALMSIAWILSWIYQIFHDYFLAE